MNIKTFIGVGENIHCTRIFKVGGAICKPLTNGGFGIHYKAGKENRVLPVPESFTRTADWEAAKIKHCAVAIWQGTQGDQAAGKDYLHQLAISQERSGATYLDINVDEYSTDIDERIRLMQWTVNEIQSAVKIPVSIDSSNEAILEAGLKAADPKRGRPMVNSVSLERVSAIDVAARYKAVVVASAAGEKGMPNTVEERMDNLHRLIPILRQKGFTLDALHIDPLVFPISTDAQNGNRFLNTVSAIRKEYGPEIHIVAGLSNISFGMPNRKLINQVYSWLAVEAGADGGIVDPSQINASILNALKPDAEDFKLARALLLGEDEYGMEYIAASRDGRI